MWSIHFANPRISQQNCAQKLYRSFLLVLAAVITELPAARSSVHPLRYFSADAVALEVSLGRDSPPILQGSAVICRDHHADAPTRNKLHPAQTYRSSNRPVHVVGRRRWPVYSESVAATSSICCLFGAWRTCTRRSPALLCICIMFRDVVNDAPHLGLCCVVLHKSASSHGGIVES